MDGISINKRIGDQGSGWFSNCVLERRGEGEGKGSGGKKRERKGTHSRHCSASSGRQYDMNVQPFVNSKPIFAPTGLYLSIGLREACRLMGG